MPATKEALLSVLCRLNRISVGDDTATLSAKFARSDGLTVEQADTFFCGRRITGRLTVIEADEDARQTNFVGDENRCLETVFEAKSFRVSPKQITCGLTFSLNGTNVGGLANHTAQLIVEKVTEIPKKKKANDS